MNLKGMTPAELDDVIINEAASAVGKLTPAQVETLADVQLEIGGPKLKAFAEYALSVVDQTDLLLLELGQEPETPLLRSFLLSAAASFITARRSAS